MSRRLHTLVDPASTTVESVAAAIPRAVRTPRRQRCLNPRCRRKIDRPDAGRLPLFCGRACRQVFDYERAELIADINVLKRALAGGGGTYAQRRALMVELATLRWTLQRYAVPTDRSHPEIEAFVDPA